MNNLGVNLRYFEGVSKKNCPTLYDEINAYQPKEIKPPPLELAEFRRIPRREKEKEEKFYRQIFIEEYLDEKWKSELYNIGCFLRLHELLQTDLENTERCAIQAKLDLFKRKIEQNEHPYRALALDFSKYGMKTMKQSNQEAVDDLNKGWDD